MSVLSGYEPKEVLKFFEEICSIPHGSGHTKAISDHLAAFARDRGLECRQDELNNIVIRKGGTPGYEDHPTVILQGHMDMVAVKTPDCDKNMETDGLDLEVLDGEYISAKGTSLGGDDGIAVAYGLAILDSDIIPHPPLEMIATVDEETGLLGAAGLDCSDIRGRTLINLDSEDEGVYVVSCAGGVRADCRLPLKREEVRGSLLTLNIGGLQGGHSGNDINKGRANALRLLGRLLYGVKDRKVRLISLEGGEKDNVIPRTSQAELIISADEDAEAVEEQISALFDQIQTEYETIEKDLFLEMEDSLTAEGLADSRFTVSAMTKDSGDRLIAALMGLPNGVQRMNPDLPDMVQTSLNMGTLKTEEDAVRLVMALRSSSESEKACLLERCRVIIEALGGSVSTYGDYPGWAYEPRSRVRDVMVQVYREQAGREPVVEGIHAGVECGLFSRKLPGLDCISAGPQMAHIHTTDEILSIPSVERTWKLLLETLARL